MIEVCTNATAAQATTTLAPRLTSEPPWWFPIPLGRFPTESGGLDSVDSIFLSQNSHGGHEVLWTYYECHSEGEVRDVVAIPGDVLSTLLLGDFICLNVFSISVLLVRKMGCSLCSQLLPSLLSASYSRCPSPSIPVALNFRMVRVLLQLSRTSFSYWP